MKFRAGIGLLLFGILLSNGSAFDEGSYLWLAGMLVGVIGLSLVFLSAEKEGKK